MNARVCFAAVAAAATLCACQSKADTAVKVGVTTTVATSTSTDEVEKSTTTTTEKVTTTAAAETLVEAVGRDESFAVDLGAISAQLSIAGDYAMALENEKLQTSCIAGWIQVSAYEEKVAPFTDDVADKLKLALSELKAGFNECGLGNYDAAAGHFTKGSALLMAATEALPS